MPFSAWGDLMQVKKSEESSSSSFKKILNS